MPDTIERAHLHALRQPRTSAALSATPSPAKTESSVRDVVTAPLRPDLQRSDYEKSLPDRLDHLWDPFRRFRASAEAFIALVRAPKETDRSGALKGWIAEVQASDVCDLVSFAVGINKDMAVVAGLSLVLI